MIHKNFALCYFACAICYENIIDLNTLFIIQLPHKGDFYIATDV